MKGGPDRVGKDAGNVAQYGDRGGDVVSTKNRSLSFLLVDPPHRIWDILKAWVPSPGCLQLAAYLLDYFDVDFMDAAGRLLTLDWEKYDTLNCVYEPRGLTVSELEKGVRALWKHTFSLASIGRRLLRRPFIHPLFYLGMNMQFHAMTRRWKPGFDPVAPRRAD